MTTNISSAQIAAEDPDIGEDLSIESELDRLQQHAATAISNLDDSDASQQSESELAGSYRQIEKRLEIAAFAVTNANSTRRFIRESPEILRKLRQELGSLRRQPVTINEADFGDTIEQMQSSLTSLRSTRASLDNTAVELERELNNFEARPLGARAELSTYREEAVNAVVSEKPAGTTEAERLSDEVESLILRARIDVLEQELLANSTHIAVLKLRQQVTEQHQERTERTIEAVEKILAVKREQRARDVDADIARDEKQAKRLHPLARSIYHQNKDYAEQLIQLETQVRNANSSLTSLTRQRKDQFRNFKTARERIEAAGNTGAMRDLLNFQRRSNPAVVELRARSAARQQAISESGAMHFNVIDRLNSITDIDAATAQLVSTSPDQKLSEDEIQDLRARVVRQLNILESLESTYTNYLDTLAATEFESKEFASEAQVYQRFLDERLLWVPNAAAVGVNSASSLVNSFLWLLNPSRWSGFLQTLLRSASSDWFTLLGVVFALFLLVYRRRSLIALIKQSNRDIASVRTDRFRHTLGAFVYTLLLCLPLPLVLFALGWFLSKAVSTDGFSEALGLGLLTIAPMVFVLQFVRALCLPAGIASQHFRWGGDPATFLKYNLIWFAPIYVIARLIWVSAETNSSAIDSSEIVRVSALVSLGALGWFVYRVFGPARPLLAPLFSGGSRVWTMRLSFIWFPLLVITPVLMIVLVLAGYLYTTREMLTRLEYSLFLIVAVYSLEALLIRGLNVAQRQLAFKRAKARWEARVNVEAETSAEGSPVTLADAEIDIATVDSQSRRFIRTLQTLILLGGLWLIWSRMLPFFGNVTDIDLWRSSSVDASGVDIAVNLRDIVFACIIIFVAWFAARNLPALLEIAILQRLPLDAGSRYAIGRIVQYTIGAAGILYVFSYLGISWSKVQWLVAALGVGIGFGLQEIFANFISGLIILFERPVRLGDTITIGELSGTVSRIRLRTTTIIDWDSKEIVVPNKHLITDRLTNWTLSDSTTRVVLKFGVAYGSDIEQTFKLVEGVARQHPDVLENPPLQLFLLALGESSLDFELRVFVSQLSERLPVTHDLLVAIEKTLTEHGIEIPYPQHEVRLRDDKSPSAPTIKLQDGADGVRG